MQEGIGESMFKPGEYIQYSSSGLCKVEEVTRLDMKGADQDKLYYRLRPVMDGGRTIFTPVDNKKVAMRRMMTREEADELISTFPQIKELDMTGDRNGQRFKQALASVDCREWVGVIKTLHGRRRRREQDGKKIPSTDEQFYRQAREKLHTEFALALRIGSDEVDQYIEKKLTE